MTSPCRRSAMGTIHGSVSCISISLHIWKGQGGGLAAQRTSLCAISSHRAFQSFGRPCLLPSLLRANFLTRTFRGPQPPCHLSAGASRCNTLPHSLHSAFRRPQRPLRFRWRHYVEMSVYAIFSRCSATFFHSAFRGPQPALGGGITLKYPYMPVLLHT